jgi:hypothetical protein
MRDRFVSYAELRDFFKNRILAKDLAAFRTLGICSIGDLLFITEDWKKENLKISSIEENYKRFENGPEKSGQISVAELTREQLNEALFEKVVEGIELWETAANRKLDPRYSISYLALRNTSHTWWSESVFQEMLESYKADGE